MAYNAGQGKASSPWKNIYIPKEHAKEFTSKAGNECYRITLPDGPYAGYSTIWPKKTARDVSADPNLLSLGYIPTAKWDYTFTKYDPKTRSVADTVVISSADIANVMSVIAVAAPPRKPKN